MARVLVPRVDAPPRLPDGALLALGGRTMGTSWSVKAYARADQAEPLGQAVQAALNEVVAQMSGWEAASDLRRFNAAPAGTWRPLPDAFFSVLSHAVTLAEQTGGAFDPTAGGLVNLWGFGPPQPGAVLPPGDAAIDHERALAGWGRLRLDPAARGALQPGGATLDLSGIAKGFGVDQAAATLEAAGAADYLVEVGGELRGRGVKADGQPWWVALEDPPGVTLEPLAVALHGLSVATSGDYVRAYRHDGHSYGHTLDPRTGRPLAGDLVSVSVLDPMCMAADALATALMVLGLEAGLAFAADRIPARFIGKDGGEHLSPAMAAMLQ